MAAEEGKASTAMSVVGESFDNIIIGYGEKGRGKLVVRLAFVGGFSWVEGDTILKRF